MKTIIVQLLTFIILALQYYFGLKRFKVMGTVLPTLLILLFSIMLYAQKSLSVLGTGVLMIIAIIVVWAVSYANSRKYETEKMKKYDII